MSLSARQAIPAALAGLALLAWSQGCGGGGAGGGGSKAPPQRAAADAPNILWIVWDTVRTDHVTVYGAERPTTPNLERFAAGARVYTDCISPGSTTAPAHASMFTGLMPSEHGSSNEHSRLDARWTTIAELLRDAGYATFCYAENPHIAREGDSENFVQGFDTVLHPWSDEYYQRAIDHVRSKIDPADQSTELARKMQAAGGFSKWNIKTGGPIGGDALGKWLAERRDGEKWFAFMNFMDAHRHLIPAREFREALMTPEQIQRSFKVDRTWDQTWSYVFGISDYSEDELELTRLTYDAAIRELDHYFGRMIDGLSQSGALDNTIVIVTADHGEHLGDHRLLDHQFSVYRALVHVPLIVHYPQAFPPGTDGSPVQTYDLFPTLLALAGLEPPADLRTRAVDLRDAVAPRPRLAEYPTTTTDIVDRFDRRNRQVDLARFRRSLRAYYEDEYKLICGYAELPGGNTLQTVELYDIVADPHELHDLATERPEVLARLQAGLGQELSLLTAAGQLEAAEQRSQEELDRLGNLGYAGGSRGGGVVTIENHCPPPDGG